MKHLIIMPKDCYKATSGRYKDVVVRKSPMGVESKASHDEVRYIVSSFSKEAIEQAWLMHTCDCVITGDYAPLTVSWIPKTNQQYKIEEYPA